MPMDMDFSPIPSDPPTPTPASGGKVKEEEDEFNNTEPDYLQFSDVMKNYLAKFGPGKSTP